MVAAVRIACLVAIVVVHSQLFSCSDSKPGLEQSAPESAIQRVEADSALAVLRLISKPIEKSALRAIAAENYRQDSGTKISDGTTRRALWETQLRDAPAVLTSGGTAELIITDGHHGLRVSTRKQLRGHETGLKRAGAFLVAHVYRFASDEALGLPKISRRSAYIDSMTVFRQAGIKGLPPGPVNEDSWPGDLIAAAAQGSEAEATQIARAREFVSLLARRDVAAAEFVAGNFNDRDVSQIEARIFPTPDDFETMLASEFSRLELSRLEATEIWAAKEWVVVHIRHSYRLVQGLKKAAGARALNYELWLLRFEGDRIAARWRFRDSLDEHGQLGLGTINDLVRAAQHQKH